MVAISASLPERLVGLRDRLLASRRFQRWAAAFPLTRAVSRRRAGALFDLVAGFAYSQVLLACVQLDAFELLAERPRTLRELAARWALSEDAAQRLVSAAVALKLLEHRRGDRIGLGPLGAPMAGNAAIVAMVRHHASVYADLRDPVALLRGAAPATQLASYWAYAGTTEPRHLHDDKVAAYSTLMSASQPLVADEILDAVAWRRHRCLLDVGGGEGGFVVSALQRAPRLRAMVFDLPAVAERARLRFVRNGLADRAEATGGDFFRDPLPRGADLATLVRVVHDHDDAAALRILSAVHAALPTGGHLLIAEPMADTRGAEAMGDAYFGFYLLAMGRGRARSPAELTELLRRAGFRGMRLLRNAMPLQTRLMWAQAAPAENPDEKPSGDIDTSNSKSKMTS